MLRDLPGNMKKFGSLLAFLSKYLMLCSLKAISMKVDLDSQSALQELCVGSSLVTLKKIILNIMQINIAVLQSEADTLVMNLVSVHLKASFTERRTQSQENNAYMPAHTRVSTCTCAYTHTHTQNQILHLCRCCHGPTLQPPIFPPSSPLLPLFPDCTPSCPGLASGEFSLAGGLFLELCSFSFFSLLSFLLLGFFVCTGAG